MLYLSTIKELIKEKSWNLVRVGINDIMICGRSIFFDDAYIADIPWKLIIVDEFHKYKNPLTKGYKQLQSLQDAAQCLILGLNGTLVSNSHKELWVLVDVVQPGLIGTWDNLKKIVSTPLTHSRYVYCFNVAQHFVDAFFSYIILCIFVCVGQRMQQKT